MYNSATPPPSGPPPGGGPTRVKRGPILAHFWPAVFGFLLLLVTESSAIGKKKRTSRPKCTAEKKAAATKPAAVVGSRAELAKRLGRSERTIGEYIGRGMPGNPGSYNVADCQAWLAESIRSAKPDEGDSSIALQIRRAELAEREENVRSKRLKNDLLEGRMYLVDEVELAAAELTNRIRERLERIPTEISQALPAKHRRTGRDRVAEIIHGILVEMAAWQPIEPKGD